MNGLDAIWRRRSLAPATAATTLVLGAIGLVPSPAEAYTGGKCQFDPAAGTVIVSSTNSSGVTGAATDARAWGAAAATDAWVSTNAPTLSVSSGTDGRIIVDVASYAYPNHGTTEWNCPNATGTGTSETYFYATVVVRLGASFNKPASTWDHVSAHEYGHALGLDHAGSSPLYVLMAGGNWPDTYCTGCRLSAASDDIAGMNTQYK